MEEGRLCRLVPGRWRLILLSAFANTLSLQGMQAQITKAVISQALLFMSKEQFEHWALAIFVILAKLRAH
jgi:hypothetical protein